MTSGDGVTADYEGDVLSIDGVAGLIPSIQRELIPFEAATSIEKVCLCIVL